MKMNCNKTDRPAWESNFDIGYREMAQDEAREAEALDLAEATIEDIDDESPTR
jgi:hypothetical protein